MPVKPQCERKYPLSKLQRNLDGLMARAMMEILTSIKRASADLIIPISQRSSKILINRHSESLLFHQNNLS
jgi:hypothetical protein